MAELNRNAVVDKKTELYDIVKMNLYDGLVSDHNAYNSLVKKYGCNDERASPYNVLKMKSYDFERIFVFFKDSGKGTLKENKLEGEK